MNTPQIEQLQLFNTPDEVLKLNEEEITRGYEPCLDTSIYSVGLGASASQQNNLGEYEQLSLWKSIPTHNSCSDITSQEFQFTQISETTNQNQESLTSLPVGFPAQAQVTQEVERDLNIQLPLFGEKDLDVLSRLNPASVLSNNLKELSDGDFELFLADSVWQDTVSRLKQSRRESLEHHTRDSDCLSFPTLTSGDRSTSRPAGQTKCEKWFKDNGLIAPGYQLSAQAIAMIMGFPPNWFDCLSPTERQEESKADISQEEQSPQDKQPLPSEEFSISTQLLGGEDKLLEHKKGERSSLSREISIPCVIKQPKQPEVRGVIKKDLGERFLVEVSDKTISISKLFVYPDFSSVGQIPPTKQVTPPSKIPPTKTRRKKGDGTGYIYRRTITRGQKQYQEFYYRYRDESGKLKAKYIPQTLLSKVQEAESRKKPIADILVLLGGDEISRGEQSSTSDDKSVPNQDKSDELISINRGEQPTPPSTRKRKQGQGTGYIECKPIKTSAGKEYQQYWYHYEEWREGARVTKKSKYIPKNKRAQIQKMNNDKVSVEEILKVLRNKSKRKQFTSTKITITPP